MLATKQYSFVRDSRKVLFDYCQTILPEEFTRENASYGRGDSIRNLLVHIANTYEFWIAKQALKMDLDYTEYALCNDMRDVTVLFENVDRFMQESGRRVFMGECQSFKIYPFPTDIRLSLTHRSFAEIFSKNQMRYGIENDRAGIDLTI